MRWTMAKAGLALFTAGALGSCGLAQTVATSRPATPSQAAYVASGVITYEDSVTVTTGVITYEDAGRLPEPAPINAVNRATAAPISPAVPQTPKVVSAPLAAPVVAAAPEAIAVPLPAPVVVTMPQPVLVSPSTQTAAKAEHLPSPTPVSSATGVSMHRSDSSCVRLQRRIESVCAGAVKDVEVHAPSKNRLEITLQCASREHAEQVAKRIVGMPELTPFDVALDLKVVP